MSSDQFLFQVCFVGYQNNYTWLFLSSICLEYLFPCFYAKVLSVINGEVCFWRQLWGVYSQLFCGVRGRSWNKTSKEKNILILFVGPLGTSVEAVTCSLSGMYQQEHLYLGTNTILLRQLEQDISRLLYLPCPLYPLPFLCCLNQSY